MKHPLSRCAASPSLASREGDDTLAAGRPLLGVPVLSRVRFTGSGYPIEPQITEKQA